MVEFELNKQQSSKCDTNSNTALRHYFHWKKENQKKIEQMMLHLHHCMWWFVPFFTIPLFHLSFTVARFAFICFSHIVQFYCMFLLNKCYLAYSLGWKDFVLVIYVPNSIESWYKSASKHQFGYWAIWRFCFQLFRQWNQSSHKVTITWNLHS